MFYLAKFFELIGIVSITVAFITYWPNPMDESVLLYGIFFFIGGWIIEKYLLKG